MHGYEGLILSTNFIGILSFPPPSLVGTNKILTNLRTLTLDPNQAVFLTASILKRLDL